MWTILGTQDEASFFDDHVRAILARERHPLPPREQRIGHVDIYWEQVAPKSAYIRAVGGTHGDRLFARAYLEAQLKGHGYRLATWSFDDFRKEATWDDVQAKAKRLIQDGAVKILRNGYENIVAQVKGDHGTYEPEIFRQDPNSRAITGSDCQCDWGSFQNTPRTRTWKQFQDRPCSHILAAYWQALATPIDEMVDPRGPGGPQDDPFYQMPGGWSQKGLKMPPPGQGQIPDMDAGPVVPGAGTTPGQFRTAPAAPSGQVGPDQMSLLQQGTPGAQEGAQALPGPSPRDVLPQFPMEGQAAGQIQPASIPGGRGPSPTNPINYPAGPGGTFSSLRHADAFANGDRVQLRYNDTGTLVGRSEAHGAGQETPIKAGQLGEVLGTDPATGMVNVLYMGSPWDQNGPMMPYGATGWHFPSYLVPRPDVRAPGPAIRRPYGVK